MSDEVIFGFRLSAAIGCGFMAGLFFTFSVSIMRALGRLPAACGMAAMQAINAAILNPVFLAVFLGTAVACLTVLMSSLWRWHEPDAGLFAVGSATYLAGAFLTTIVINVPMNEALAQADPGAPDSAGGWTRYLARWTAWNHLRTLASVAATIVLTFALAK